MAEYLVQDTSLTTIADAIRTHTGDTDALTLDAMAEAIAGLEVGGDVQMETGTFQVAEETDITYPNYYAVSHGLGVAPDMIVVVPDYNYPHYTKTGIFTGLVMYRYMKNSGYRRLFVCGPNVGAGTNDKNFAGSPTDTTLYVGNIGSTAAAKLTSDYGFKWWAIKWKWE